MGPILIYGHPLGSSLGLIMALEWLGQPYQLSRVDMLTEMKTDAYLPINPKQETPVLVTAERAFLTETMAIAAHLEAHDGGRCISFAPESAEADRMRELTAFINTSFTGAFGPLWAALEMKSNPPVQEALRSFGRESVLQRHRHLEAMLADTPFMLGDKPTIADAVFAGVARWADFHDVKVENCPRVTALKRRIEATPAFQFALAIENGEAPATSAHFRGHVALTDLVRRTRERN